MPVWRNAASVSNVPSGQVAAGTAVAHRRASSSSTIVASRVDSELGERAVQCLADVVAHEVVGARGVLGGGCGEGRMECGHEVGRINAPSLAGFGCEGAEAGPDVALVDEGPRQVEEHSGDGLVADGHGWSPWCRRRADQVTGAAGSGRFVFGGWASAWPRRRPGVDAGGGRRPPPVEVEIGVLPVTPSVRWVRATRSARYRSRRRAVRASAP